jgi:hypothetical protein
VVGGVTITTGFCVPTDVFESAVTAVGDDADLCRTIKTEPPPITSNATAAAASHFTGRYVTCFSTDGRIL